MTKSLLTAFALALLLTGTALTTARADGTPRQLNQPSKPDCTQIRDAQERAACLRKQGG